jgi:hypothetical protein
MSQNSSYLLMRVQWTTEQHTEAEHRQSVAKKLPERHSSVVGGGVHLLLPLNDMLIHFFYSFRFSVLPALSLNDGIIHCDIMEGAFNAELFQCFIECLLEQMQTFPSPNSVIVMDNCRIHKNPAILDLITEW